MRKNISDTTYLLDYLGFTIHPDKSVLKPTQIITCLVFIIDSRNMCVRLTEERANNIVEMASDLIKKRCVTIRQFAQVIGKLVAAEPGVEFATLYTKSLEISKDKVLKENKGNFDAKLCLTNGNIIDLTWCNNNVKTALKSLTRQEPTMILKTDSSQHGWGGVVKNTVLNKKGYWSYEEQKYHINYLELKAAFLCVKHFCSTKSDIHVKVFMDNMVAVNYINKMGVRIKI